MRKVQDLNSNMWPQMGREGGRLPWCKTWGHPWTPSPLWSKGASLKIRHLCLLKTRRLGLHCWLLEQFHTSVFVLVVSPAGIGMSWTHHCWGTQFNPAVDSVGETQWHKCSHLGFLLLPCFCISHEFPKWLGVWVKLTAFCCGLSSDGLSLLQSHLKSSRSYTFCCGCGL